MGLLRTWRARWTARRLGLAKGQLEAQGGGAAGPSAAEVNHAAMSRTLPYVGSTLRRKRGATSQTEWRGD